MMRDELTPLHVAGQLKLVLMGAEATHFMRGQCPAQPGDTEACQRLDTMLCDLQDAWLDVCARPCVWDAGTPRQTMIYLVEDTTLVPGWMLGNPDL